MKKNSYDIAIIGGGASGLTAAISVKRKNAALSVLVVEKMPSCGKKLAASGNGRCNITNASCEGHEETVRFMNSIGIAVKELEEGRYYPCSEDAKSVVEAFTEEAIVLGAEIVCDCNCEKIFRNENAGKGFELKLKESGVSRFVKCSKLLIASGGKSYASYGTTGDGYNFAKELGHSLTTLIPGLTAIEVLEDTRTLKGVRAKSIVRLLKDGEVVCEEAGEVQFREDSISGICIMNLSNLIARDGKYELSIDLLNGMSPEEIERINGGKLKCDGSDRVKLNTLVKSQLADYIKKNKADVNALHFSVKGLKGWKEAQITRGGVLLEELNDDYSSKLVEGLYFTGEVTEYSGKCGGFNLNNAFLSGMKAGNALAE